MRKRDHRHRRRIVPLIGDWITAQLAFLVLWLLRVLGPDLAPRIVGGLARRFGPMLKTSRVARENLALAMPDLSEAEREGIVRGVWENLGRTAAEYPHLETYYDFEHDDSYPVDEQPPAPRSEVKGSSIFLRLADSNQPVIVFAAHLANWELPAVCAAKHGLEATTLYRPPNNRFIADYILSKRQGVMGKLVPATRQASLEMAAVLAKGGILGVLVDQSYFGGIRAPFFGIEVPSSPVVARLARQFDCPVHGCRAVRLPGGRFRLELTEALDLPRDGDGKIDLVGATTAVNAVIEGWIREHPEQWLWLHRRWKQR